jgi:hypothetical protein
LVDKSKPLVANDVGPSKASLSGLASPFQLCEKSNWETQLLRWASLLRRRQFLAFQFLDRTQKGVSSSRNVSMIASRYYPLGFASQ